MKMLKWAIKVAAVLLSYSIVDAGDYSIINITDKCDYHIQVNEGDQVLLAFDGEIQGEVRSFRIWDIGYGDKCLIKECSLFSVCQENDILEVAGRELSRKTFKNLNGENCFLDNIGFVTGADGGFFTYYSWFEHVSFTVSCEGPASIPEYCGKSEKYARVILQSHEAKCDSLGGVFEGGVYPQTAPDGGAEHCVSGSCYACDSKWREDLIDEWKDEVCCGERGKEPNRNNGMCQEPAHNPNRIGVSYPRITAFPGCSSTPAGQSEISFCDPPSSSSSEPPSSSSQFSSSSEDMEDVECPADGTEASAKLSAARWRCEMDGKGHDFWLDRWGCVVGGCTDMRSSSSAGASSSSSDYGDVCTVSKRYLPKEADVYDDWAYLGKEGYGSKHVARSSLKPGTKFFDVLGRAYDKMKARIMYYVSRDAIKRDEFDVPLEFEVYGRVIKDGDGNSIQLFFKEDKENGLRRDSSFYWDGSWEVFEIFEKNDNSKEISLRMSSGTKSMRRYDGEERLT
jgi:hypothetical protein